MKTIRLLVGSLIFVMVATSACWFARPHRRPSPLLVEPKLARLTTPFRSVSVHHYYDGGSIGVEIVDAAGRREQFAIPCHMGSGERYERVFVGALHDKNPNAVEVSHAVATKQELVYILANSRGDDPYIDSALASLAGRPLDYVRCFIHHYQGHYDDY